MKKFLTLIKKCPLFDGIDEVELEKLLICLSAVKKSYEKNSFIFSEDEKVTSVGIVLSGNIHVVREDFWGNRTIFARIEPGSLFGEAFSCADIDKMPVSVFATEKSEILLIDYNKIIKACPSSCTFHVSLIKNMLRILAKKNVMLTQKIEFITQRTTREKLLSYLSAQARQSGSNLFEIPFNRQELAEYLSIDRSAMSNELSKMQNDGILKFRRNCFELL